MFLGSIHSYSCQVFPHYSQVSSSASLHYAHVLLFLFLFHFSTTYLPVLVVPRVLSEVLFLAYALWPWAGVTSGMGCNP